MTPEIAMCEILAAALPSIPIVADASDLLRNYPRRTLVATSGIATHAARMAGYDRPMASLIPNTVPFPGAGRRTRIHPNHRNRSRMARHQPS